MVTSSNRLPNRCWARLWGPFPSDASLAMARAWDLAHRSPLPGHTVPQADGGRAGGGGALGQSPQMSMPRSWRRPSTSRHSRRCTKRPRGWPPVKDRHRTGAGGGGGGLLPVKHSLGAAGVCPSPGASVPVQAAGRLPQHPLRRCPHSRVVAGGWAALLGGGTGETTA